MLYFIIILILLLLNFIYLYYRYYSLAKKIAETYYNTILHVTFIYEKMKQIDKDGAFASTDSVGYVFKLLKELVDSFDIYTKVINSKEDKNVA